MLGLTIDDPNKVFFTSDTHWGHFNICKYCNRPFESRADMDLSLIENWNSRVPEDGIVIHCGDFMLPHSYGIKEYKKYIEKLNGTIYLCRGNHDRIDTGTYQSLGEDKLIVNDMLTLTIKEISILACHYPILSHPFTFQVFGHIHTLNDGTCSEKGIIEKLNNNQYDVGVDQNDYTPISYYQLMKKFEYD